MPRTAASSTARPSTPPPPGPIQTELGPDTFVVVEKWSSLDTLKAHGASAHMAAYAATVKPLLSSRVIHVLAPA